MRKESVNDLIGIGLKKIHDMTIAMEDITSVKGLVST
jgi:hypothetical protein